MKINYITNILNSHNVSERNLTAYSILEDANQNMPVCEWHCEKNWCWNHPRMGQMGSL